MHKFLLIVTIFIVIFTITEVKLSPVLLNNELLSEPEFTRGLVKHMRKPRQYNMDDYYQDPWSDVDVHCVNCKVYKIGNGVGNHNVVHINKKH